jgi:hypothetical protein
MLTTDSCCRPTHRRRPTRAPLPRKLKHAMRTDIDWQIAAYLTFYEDEGR